MSLLVGVIMIRILPFKQGFLTSCLLEEVRGRKYERIVKNTFDHYAVIFEQQKNEVIISTKSLVWTVAS